MDNEEFEKIVSEFGETQEAESEAFTEAVKESFAKSADLLGWTYETAIDSGVPHESAVHIVNDIWEIISGKGAA